MGRYDWVLPVGIGVGVLVFGTAAYKKFFGDGKGGNEDGFKFQETIVESASNVGETAGNAAGALVGSAVVGAGGGIVKGGIGAVQGIYDWSQEQDYIPIIDELAKGTLWIKDKFSGDGSTSNQVIKNLQPPDSTKATDIFNEELALKAAQKGVIYKPPKQTFQQMVSDPYRQNKVTRKSNSSLSSPIKTATQINAEKSGKSKLTTFQKKYGSNVKTTTVKVKGINPLGR